MIYVEAQCFFNQSIYIKGCYMYKTKRNVFWINQFISKDAICIKLRYCHIIHSVAKTGKDWITMPFQGRRLYHLTLMFLFIREIYSAEETGEKMYLILNTCQFIINLYLCNYWDSSNTASIITLQSCTVQSTRIDTNS